jgi:uncharacterized membrane protein HdeD (DUF308 family)
MAKEARKRKAEYTMPFGKKNLQILSIGLLLIVLGYISMAQPPVNSFWTLSLAPVLLLAAYLVIIPYAIMYGHKLFARAQSAEAGEEGKQDK